MKNKMYTVFSVTLSISLSGCMGIYEGGFECPAGTGVGCKSISDVNMMVNQREIPKDSAVQSSENPVPVNLEIWYAPTFRRQMQEIRNQKDSLMNSEQRKGAKLTDA